MIEGVSAKTLADDKRIRNLLHGKTADDWAMQTAKTFKELKNQKIS